MKMGDELSLGQIIYRVACFDKDDKPIAMQTKESLDLRDVFMEYGIIVPKDVPKPIRDDLHSICIYYKMAQLQKPITLQKAREMTREMTSNG
jgi:hypothetical protein